MTNAGHERRWFVHEGMQAHYLYLPLLGPEVKIALSTASATGATGEGRSLATSQCHTQARCTRTECSRCTVERGLALLDEAIEAWQEKESIVNEEPRGRTPVRQSQRLFAACSIGN